MLHSLGEPTRLNHGAWVRRCRPSQLLVAKQLLAKDSAAPQQLVLQPLHCTGLPATMSGAQLQTVGSGFTTQGMHRGFPALVVLGMEISLSFLGVVYLRPKINLWEGTLGRQLEKTNGKWDVREAHCLAWRGGGGGELLKQHMPPSAPLLSACGLYTLQVFVFKSRSFSFTFLGDFLSNAVYVYFLFPSQCLPTPMAVFFLL